MKNPKSTSRVTGHRARILLVDSMARNLRTIEPALLDRHYDLLFTGNGKDLLEKARDTSPDLILLDIAEPEMDGCEILDRLKTDEKTRSIPVVVVTSPDDVECRVTALERGADEFLSRPVEINELLARVRSLLKLKAYNDQLMDRRRKLEEEVSKTTVQLTKAFDQIQKASLDTIYRLSRAAEYKDKDTGSHIRRMSHYSIVIASCMGLEDLIVGNILFAAPMHDIGKIGIPDSILLKPVQLDEDEWEIMKTHTLIGGKILEGSDVDFIQLAEEIALTHHEKWDGSGYPMGLAGEEIPVAGRVVAIADYFDALASQRPYKEPFSLEICFQMIREASGTHFDPKVVKAFFSAKDEILSIRKRIRE